ncbi:MAG: hypothetical protein GY943_32510 [Chloroflexi bacterium]|nr:hypothetical protein [Chloroflexota bacterium]
MFDFMPATLVFLIQIYLLISWLKSRQKKDGKEKRICFWGFLFGQIYLLLEVLLVNQTGKPLPGSPEQKMLMGRLLLGGSMGGLFTILGLFYLSFASFSRQK